MDSKINDHSKPIDLKSVLWLEREFDIRQGFVSELQSENDWSFTIKVHTLLTAVVSQMLYYYFDAKLGNRGLDPVINRLELSNPSTGKMAIVSALELLPKQCRTFILKLSQLRNIMAHDIGTVDFDYAQYVRQLDTGGWTSFKRELCCMADLDDESDVRESVAVNAKMIILESAKEVVKQARETCKRAREQKIT